VASAESNTNPLEEIATLLSEMAERVAETQKSFDGKISRNVSQCLWQLAISLAQRSRLYRAASPAVDLETRIHNLRELQSELNQAELQVVSDIAGDPSSPHELFRVANETIQRIIRREGEHAMALSDAILIAPVFSTRRITVDPKSAFIVMPFGEDWSDRIWRRFIKPITAREGFSAVRADDMFGADIMEDIWTAIMRARVVIGDATGRNANVFYELGIAHTVGKDVILLTQDVSDIPFDLNRYRHIVYADNLDGYDLLKDQLRGALRDLRTRDAVP